MTLVKAIAVIYGLAAGLTRESTDVQVRAAFRKVSRKAHPDRGGFVPTHMYTCAYL